MFINRDDVSKCMSTIEWAAQKKASKRNIHIHIFKKNTLWTFPSFRVNFPGLITVDWVMPEKSLKINTLFFFFECMVKVNGVTQLNSRQLNQTTFTINSFHWQPCGPSFPVITQMHCLHHCVFLDEALQRNWFANDSLKCWGCHLDCSYRSIQSQTLPVLGMKCMCHPVCKAYFLSSEHWRIAVSSAFASSVHKGVRFLTSIWSLVINITPRKQA